MDALGGERGAEALLRWRHPQRGFVPPALFVPIAEDSSLISELGAWVLEQGCRLIADEAARGRALDLSVNVSPRQLQRADFADRVRHVLTESGIAPQRLTLEITERLLLDNGPGGLARMQELAALGLRFSIDDSGAGYSSLAHLKRLPLHELKIDQRFVRDVPGDRNDAAVIEAILSMAHRLGFEVVTEGAETSRQQAHLAAQGCDLFQGCLHHRPEPAADRCRRREFGAAMARRTPS